MAEDVLRVSNDVTTQPLEHGHSDLAKSIVLRFLVDGVKDADSCLCVARCKKIQAGLNHRLGIRVPWHVFDLTTDELLEANSDVTALVRLYFGQAYDLVLSQASFQALKSANELRLAETSSCCLRILFTPLDE